MPMHAASAMSSSQLHSSNPHELESEHSAKSVHDSQGYHVMHPTIAAVPKTKSGQYAHAIFSVAERSTITTPLLIRALDFAHVVVHHPVSQAIDCLLSVYIALLTIIKVPRRLQLDLDAYRTLDFSTLFISSYIVCFVVFTSELILQVLARYSSRAVAQKLHPAKKFGFFNVAADLLVCSSLAADIILYLSGNEHGVSFIGLRVFKIFKYLRVWSQFSDLDNILESVYDSMAMMANIFSALIVTLILYCIIAVQLFSDCFYSVCTSTNNISAPLIPVQYCESSSQCPSGFDCVESPDNLPIMGTYAFDNSWNALIQLVQVVLPDQWPPIIMNPVAQSNPGIIVVVRIYFYSLVVFDALVLLNLCIAVMSFAFQRIRDAAKEFEPEVRAEDPKLQSLRSIALELNPSIFSKHVKRSFHAKLASNVVAPEATTDAAADDADDPEPNSTLPPAPGKAAVGFRRKAKVFASRPMSMPVSTQPSETKVSFTTAWAKFHYFCLHFANLPAFEYFILVVVCLNCLTLAVPYRGIPQSFTNILDIIELVFTGIFLFEMLLKIISFGVRKYISENWFDFIVIVFSVVDLLTTYAFTAQQLPNLTVLRMFRVLRIFRALKRIKKLMQVLGMIFKSAAALRNLLIFAFVWFSAVAVVGKEIFGNRRLLGGLHKKDFDRMNFDSIMNSYELLFRVATGEAWSSLMHKFMIVKYDAVLFESDPKIVNETNTAPAFFFFVPFYLFANFILINVLVSVILENFEVSNVDRAEEYLRMLSAEDEDIRVHQKNSLSDAKASIFEWFSAKQAQEQGYIKKISLHLRNISNSSVVSNASSELQNRKNVTKSPSSTSLSGENNTPPVLNLPSENSLEKGAKLSRSQSSIDSLDSSRTTSATLLWTPGTVDRVRILSYKVLKSSWYPYVLYGTIALSSFTLAFTPAKHQTTALDDPPYVYINVIFWIIFFMEFAFNVLQSPVSYFCMGWNLLDFVILVLTTIDLLGSLDVINLRLSFFRVIRLVRALRPLRMLNKNENIRNVVNTVIGSLSSVAYVVALYLILCLMFSVVALQLFRAKMDYCNDESSVGFLDCAGVFIDAAHEGKDAPSVLMPRVWSTARSNFDDVGRGMITLFRVTTMQWTTIYFSICDIVDEDINRKENANVAQGLFILAFIIIAGYCIINMFVAVIVEFFKTSSGSRLLTPWQKSWVQTRRFVSALKFETPAPKNKLRHTLHRIVHHNYFELLISCVIFANGLVMLLQSRNQSASFDDITGLVNDVALYIFIVEMIMKIIAFGPLTYCRDNWNLFDASLVIFSITMNYFIEGSSFESAGQLLRLLRLFRLLRLIRQFNSFKILWDAFVISIWPILNIFLLIFLFFWIYSVIGVSQFGHTRPGVNWVGSGFDTFPRTFLTLGNLVSGENWDTLFDDVSIEYPYCTEDTIGPDGEISIVGDCGSQAAASIYFIMFILIIRFMLMNLFLAVVVENFSICFEPIEGLIEPVHVDHFLKVFACFCHKEHRFSSLQEYLTFWNSLPENERENIYGDPSDLLHRSHLQKFLAALRVNPNTGEQAGMTGYSNPLGGHLLGYHGRRHYLCVRAEIEDFIQEKMLREAPLSARVQKYFVEKWRKLKKAIYVWFMKLTKQRQPSSSASVPNSSLAERKAFVLKRFRKAAVLAYRQSTGQSLSASNRHGWQYMVEQLRMREQERLQNSLSREELFTILITWSVPVTHLTEIERRKRQEIVDRFHRQSAQQLIHAMFVGKKVRAARQNAAAGSKSKFKVASKFMSKASKPLSQKILETEEKFEEIEVIRRASSKNPDQTTVAEEQEAFVRTCIKSKAQMVSSKKLLEKIMRDCITSQMKLTELACPPDDSQNASPIPSARQSNSITQASPTKGKEAKYTSPAMPGTPL